MDIRAVLVKPFWMLLFGALLVFSGIQFYRQQNPPSSPVLGYFYYALHGTHDYAQTLPWPRNGAYQWNESTEIRVRLGEQSKVFYVRLVSVILSENSTDLDLVFSAHEGTLPGIKALAPQPTIRIGGDVFPVRNITAESGSGPEMQYRFTFASLEGARGGGMAVYLNDSDLAPDFGLANPELPDWYFTSKGSNLWGSLTILSVILFIGGAVTNSSEKGFGALAKEWQKMDFERRQLAERFNIPVEQANAERYAAAKACIDRAERAIMGFYESHLGAQRTSGVLFIGFLIMVLFCVVLMLIAWPSGWGIHASTEELSGGSTGISQRIAALEAARHKPYMFMLLAAGTAVAGVVINYVWSAARIKKTAEAVAREQLEKLSRVIEKTVSSDVRAVEGKLQQQMQVCSEADKKLKAACAHLRTVHDTCVDSLENALDNEVETMIDLSKELKEKIKTG